jgi:hypothetical protein
VSIPLILLGNGRKDCISQAIPSAREHLKGLGSLVVVDDSGDDTYRDWLAAEFDVMVAGLGNGRVGYWRAMQAVWALMSYQDGGHAFFLEHWTRTRISRRSPWSGSRGSATSTAMVG